VAEFTFLILLTRLTIFLREELRSSNDVLPFLVFKESLPDSQVCNGTNHTYERDLKE